MWKYEKMLQYPVKIRKRNLKMANLINAQVGGPQGELGAALRYLNQSFTMPDDVGKALLTDIGTEELGHVEMLQTLIKELTKGATVEEIKAAGFDKHFVEHGMDLFPANPEGIPFTTAYISAVGDTRANLVEDLAAEEKARSVYENLIELCDDEDVKQVLLFLRQREVVHFARFKELLEYYEAKNML